jgi:hypothetical protein
MDKGKFAAFIVAAVLAAIGCITGATVNIKIERDKYEATIEYSAEQKPAAVEDDMGEIIEIEQILDEPIPTVEEIDGGKFEDIDTGVSLSDGEYADLGATIETFDTSTPEAFKNATYGLCVYASNRFGAQCVSLARSFWYSYAGRDVSTCGTGMAKGMLNCADQNAGDDFEVYWAEAKNEIQAGDWLIFDGGQYGHVGMALGPANNGYVALLGENQGGKPCDGGGAATNIINISLKNLIGFYRPKAYIKPAPAPEPVVEKCESWDVVAGDTMGLIMKQCEGKIAWGNEMNQYANTWVSKKTGKTVFFGWTHGTGYGLFANDTIYRVK